MLGCTKMCAFLASVIVLYNNLYLSSLAGMEIQYGVFIVLADQNHQFV